MHIRIDRRHISVCLLHRHISFCVHKQTIYLSAICTDRRICCMHRQICLVCTDRRISLCYRHRQRTRLCLLPTRFRFPCSQRIETQWLITHTTLTTIWSSSCQPAHLVHLQKCNVVVHSTRNRQFQCGRQHCADPPAKPSTHTDNR